MKKYPWLERCSRFQRGRLLSRRRVFTTGLADCPGAWWSKGGGDRSRVYHPGLAAVKHLGRQRGVVPEISTQPAANNPTFAPCVLHHHDLTMRVGTSESQMLGRAYRARDTRPASVPARGVAAALGPKGPSVVCPLPAYRGPLSASCSTNIVSAHIHCAVQAQARRR